MRQACNVVVSGLLESRATDEERAQSLDLADYLVKFDRHQTAAQSLGYEHLFEIYEERSAIIEFEANFTRTEAELLAWQQTCRKGKVHFLRSS